MEDWFAMAQAVALSSSDGRFNVAVASDDAELIASTLLLLELPRGAAPAPALDHLEQIARRRERRCRAGAVRNLHAVPAA